MMEWLTNELLFYGGIAVCGLALLFAITLFCVSKIRAVKLNARLEAEFGKKNGK